MLTLLMSVCFIPTYPFLKIQLLIKRRLKRENSKYPDILNSIEISFEPAEVVVHNVVEYERFGE
jgi:hypothetical protein